MSLETPGCRTVQKARFLALLPVPFPSLATSVATLTGANAEVEAVSELSPRSAVRPGPKQSHKSALEPRNPRRRSKVTNGVRILAGLTDGRTHAARRYADLVALVCVDQGGVDCMSEAKLQLARRFAGLAVQLEALETRLANGEPINVVEYTALTSSLVRVVSRLGLERQQRDVTPTLAEYLATLRQCGAEADKQATEEGGLDG
jgi:hypothetical protein